MSEIEYFGKTARLIVSEIDNVLTSGNITIDEIGNILYKTFNSKDFEAINELKKYFTVVFLSADNKINYNLCRRKSYPFYWGKNEGEKYNRLIEILKRYSCTPDEVIYIGSKISDRKCIQLIPESLCPDDADEYLKNICFASFIKNSGTGIFSELLFLLQDRIKNIGNSG
jgi:3-deoxy-D-manno-octulosonate 8-phosphate phosphatase KdsC-like HAD superfamily phosphatase